MTLPIDEVDEPLRSVKLAEIRGIVAPRVHPIGRYRRRAYEHLEPTTARCHHRSHDAPAIECTCGFHAVRHVDQLPEVTTVVADSVVLDVELSGTVVEHEHGYRAEQQSVLGVRFPAACSWCGAEATRVVAGRIWRSSCARCLTGARRGRAMTRADATARLGVDVVFDRLPTERRRHHVLGSLRAIGMLGLALLPLLLLGRADASKVTAAAMVAVVLCSAVWCAATVLARSIRPHRSFFVAQSGCLFAASLLLMAATP